MQTLSCSRVGLPLRAESEVDPLLSACEKVVSMGCRQEVRDSVRLESDPEGPAVAVNLLEIALAE
jgi:hypothetical protein